MKIKEYIILRDGEQHPYLKTKTEFDWNKSFLITENIINFFNESYFMNQLDEEYVYIISLNCQMKPLGVFQLSHGNWFQTDIKMRELGIFLLLTGAERFIIAHNHPNGSCQPSEGDFKSAFGIAVVLLVIVLGINLATKALTKHFDVTRKE